MMPAVLAEPVGFDRARLARLLAADWGIEASEMDYLPVGFGTHHWRVAERVGGLWFVNVDVLAHHHLGHEAAWARAALEGALSGAIALREGGLEFVHAPVRNRQGEVMAGWDGYAVSVYSFVDGQGYPYGDFPDEGLRREVLHALGRLHTAIVPSGLLRADDLDVPGRVGLAALDLGKAWGTGPFAEPARQLLVAAQPRLADLWRRLDDLVPSVASTSRSWVPTHGEPHAGNVMTTPDGPVLVDWDTLLVAPRERDLWRSQPWDGHDQAAYGTTAKLDEDAVALYRLRWDLADICAYAADLHAPHVDDANTRLAWQCLRGYLA